MARPKSNKPKKKKLCVTLREETIQKLQKEAAKKRLFISELVDLIVEGL